MARWMRCDGPTFAIIVDRVRENWGRDTHQPVCRGCLNEYLDFVDELGLPEPDDLIFVVDLDLIRARNANA